MLFAIDRLIHVLEKVSNFHQEYVSNAYHRLHVVKEQIFISSAKHTPEYTTLKSPAEFY